MTAAYDAGALTLATAGDRELWADHRARLESGHRPVTTAPVGACGTSDVVDAHLVHAAVAEGVATILTSDPGDIGRLLAERGARRVRIQVV